MISFLQKNAGMILGLSIVGSFLLITLFLAVSAFFVLPVRDTFVVQESAQSQTYERAETTEVFEELPIRVVIEVVGVDSRINTPESQNVGVLDRALTQGAVHYPGSGVPGEGNMLLFGHSTSLSNVINQAYKTFNGVQNLKKGDEIVVYTPERKHVYKVLSVQLVNADEALVDFSNNRDMLTLSTCNTFGAKQERFVVEADHVSSVSVDI